MPALSSNEPYFLIGHLVNSPNWFERLSLSVEQQEAIRRLDGLVRAARDNTCLTDAEYLDGAPADYREFHNRSAERQSETIHHARRMVMLGLLTTAQAEVVMQHHLMTISPIHTLANHDVQAALAFTPEQSAQLRDVWRKINARQGQLNLMTSDQREKAQNASAMAVNNREGDEAAMSILSPTQRKVWSQLTVKRGVPASPQALPGSVDVDGARREIAPLSPTFRSLFEQAGELKLSAVQQNLLDELVSLTSQGVLWINKDGGENVTERRDEFLRQAEQVALDGILTAQQTEQLQTLVKTSRHAAREATCWRAYVMNDQWRLSRT